MTRETLPEPPAEPESNEAGESSAGTSKPRLRNSVVALALMLGVLAGVGIQDRTRALIDRAAAAVTDLFDAIIEVQAAGATDEQLAPIRKLQRKAMWRLDYIASENSKGFPARQEAARILGESMDYSRQAIALCYKLNLNPPQATEAVAAE